MCSMNHATLILNLPSLPLTHPPFCIFTAKRTSWVHITDVINVYCFSLMHCTSCTTSFRPPQSSVLHRQHRLTMYISSCKPPAAVLKTVVRGVHPFEILFWARSSRCHLVIYFWQNPNEVSYFTSLNVGISYSYHCIYQICCW